VYDPELGRWLSADPLESVTGEIAEMLPEGPGLYAYVGNDPINFIDSNGLGKVGFLIRTSQNLWRKVSGNTARRVLDNGGDVKVCGKGASGKAKKLAHEQWGGKKVRHDPHAAGQMKHWQFKNGGKGHVFYSGTMIGAFGSNWFTEAVDFLNPIRDAADLMQMADDADQEKQLNNDKASMLNGFCPRG
jgi:hypothetical protein